MASPDSPAVSPSDRTRNGVLSQSPDTGKTSKAEKHRMSDKDMSPGQESGNDSDARPQVPTQKRRRVTRACDECRRKKIKCDGKQPCTHCTVYSYECTYDQPSNRRRNPAPQYIEALEQRLQKAEAIIRSVLPGIDFDDPKFDAHGVEQILETNRAARVPTQPRVPVPVTKSDDDDAQMHSMVDRAGSLDLDDTGKWDYHGHSSGYMFMRKFRAQFGDSFLLNPLLNPRPIENKPASHMVDSPRSVLSSSFDVSSIASSDLPSREIAIELCRNAIDDACALQRPIHRPTFFRRLRSIYDTDPEQYTNDHVRFLPCLYLVMALGSLFARTDDENNPLDRNGYKLAVEQGYQYFNMGKSMLDITDCRDLLSIQAVAFMILFLQGTAKLATCYAYVGIALRSCCRLGMHRKIDTSLNFVEQEERKRIFWMVRKMDVYVGAMLGLPQMLSGDDIDQVFPAEVSDECITEDGIQPTPSHPFPLLKATNAHARLMYTLQKVVRYVYPVKPTGTLGSGETYSISHGRIRELERDLQTWMDELPVQLRPADHADLELLRVQQLLRMSYAYVQMMIYRPFLHYVSQSPQSGQTDKRSFACAAACVSVARNIVHITTEMRRRRLLVGSYWFVMYTTYFAILSLVYFVVENPDSAISKDILKDAEEGRQTLAGLAKRSMAADRCTQSLASLFDELPEKMKERRSSLQGATSTSTRKNMTASDPSVVKGPVAAGASSSASDVRDGHPVGPNRPRTKASDHLTKPAKRHSMPDPSSVISSPYTYHSEGTGPTSHPPSLGNVSLGTSAAPPVPAAAANANTSAPQVGHHDTGHPSPGQSRLLDLKNVMFPGDNPFAYPNQPMMVLDDQFGGFPDPPFGTDAFSGGNLDMTDGTAGADPGRVSTDFDADMTNMGNGHRFAPPHVGAGPPAPFFDLSNMVPETEAPGIRPSQPTAAGQQHPADAHELQLPGQGPEDDYWSHAPGKGQFRTGLTPGGVGVNLNLDDIFGQSQGWGGSLGMGMGMGMGMGTNDMLGTSTMWQGPNGPSGWQ